MAHSIDDFNRRRLRSSNITVVISISLVLFLVGLFGLILINAQKYSDYIKEQLVVAVYFDEYLDPKDSAKAGEYQQETYKLISGQKYVHTINPKTGRPQPSNLLSATVIAPSAMLADGYATTLMALGGIEKAKDFLAQHKELKAVLLYSDEAHKGQIQKYVTENLTIEFENQTLSGN